MVGVGARDQPQALDPERARLGAHVLALAREHVRSPSVDMDGRIGGRHLQDVALEGGQGGADRGVVGARRGGGDAALGIVGVGGGTETNREAVGLEAVGDEGDGLGRLAQGDRQKPGRRGVEGAGMARLARVEQRRTGVGDGGRGRARGLVDDDPARDVAAGGRAAGPPSAGAHDAQDRPQRAAEVAPADAGRPEPRDAPSR